MTIEEALKGSGIVKSEAEILLAFLLGHDRSWLLAHGDQLLSDGEIQQYRTLCTRRAGCEPVSYIMGYTEFFGLRIHVSPAVLIPRPCTERLVERTVHMLKNVEHPPLVGSENIDSGIRCSWWIWGALGYPLTIVDLGTGSGCIAIALASALPTLPILAIDQSSAALRQAEENIRTHHLTDRIRPILSDDLAHTLADITSPFLVVTNPPYISSRTPLPCDVATFEPSDALFGGEDGGEVIQYFVETCIQHPQCRGMVMEHRDDQWSSIDEHLSRVFPHKSFSAKEA